MQALGLALILSRGIEDTILVLTEEGDRIAQLLAE
jgi:hypothetical protein